MTENLVTVAHIGCFTWGVDAPGDSKDQGRGPADRGIDTIYVDLRDAVQSC